MNILTANLAIDPTTGTLIDATTLVPIPIFHLANRKSRGEARPYFYIHERLYTPPEIARAMKDPEHRPLPASPEIEFRDYFILRALGRGETVREIAANKKCTPARVHRVLTNLRRAGFTFPNRNYHGLHEERDNTIRAQYAEGVTMKELMERYTLSRARLYQIIHAEKAKTGVDNGSE